jgi:(2Fe-2S) ferredoxin
MAAPVPTIDGVERFAFVCESSSCYYQGSVAVREALAKATGDQACGNLAIVRTGCLGLCGAGPAVVSYPAGDVHLRVEPTDAAEMAAQLATGAPLARRAVRAPQWYRDRITERLAYFVQILKRRQQPA